MDKAKVDKIIKFLTSVGSIKPCHRCGHPSHTVLNEEVNFSSEETSSGAFAANYKQEFLPTYILACQRCGAITFHAMATFEASQNPKK